LNSCPHQPEIEFAAIFNATQNCDDRVVYIRPAFKDCREFDPEYVSDWCEHGFELHSQLFLLTYPEQIKAYDILSSVFI